MNWQAALGGYEPRSRDEPKPMDESEFQRFYDCGAMPERFWPKEIAKLRAEFAVDGCTVQELENALDDLMGITLLEQRRDEYFGGKISVEELAHLTLHTLEQPKQNKPHFGSPIIPYLIGLCLITGFAVAVVRSVIGGLIVVAIGLAVGFAGR